MKIHRINSVVTLACIAAIVSSLVGCQSVTQPKPDGFLALSYPTPVYKAFDSSCNYSFETNSWSSIKSQKDCNFEIHYPEMKATIFINYKPITHNLDNLLKDAQKLTYEHFIKADEIIEQPYIDESKKVYGMFYEVAGDAATNVQFYATDSVHNFVVASLYFYAKPNFDSILPATHYVKQDMRKLMESLKWKDHN